MKKRQGIVRQRKGAFINDEKNKITTRVEQKSEPIGYDSERSSSPTCSPQDIFFGSKTRQGVPFYGCDYYCFGGLDIWLVTIIVLGVWIPTINTIPATGFEWTASRMS